MNNLEILRKFVSTQGYKKDSPDKNNPINIIPSNQITMGNVEFPVIGVDNLGNQILMQPGQNYEFEGDYVTEFPIRQQGGQMNEEIMNQVAQAIQQGANPDEIVQALIQQGLGEPEAMQLVNNVMSQLETQLPQAQYGMQVTNHNKVSNLNFGDPLKFDFSNSQNLEGTEKFKQNVRNIGQGIKDYYKDNTFGERVNRNALTLNSISDPRNLTWALPDKGIGSGFKAISGLASGLTGTYLGYAKMFSKDRTTDITPVSAINKISSAQIQAPYMNTDSEKALPTPWGKEQTPPNWLNPYNGTPDIQGTNKYSTYKEGGMKKYQFAGQTIDDAFPYESSQKQTTYGQPGRNRYDAIVDGYPNNTNQQYNTNPYFYTLPIAEYVANAQNIGNMDFTGNSMMNDGRGLNFSNPSNPLNKTSEQLKKEKEYITSRGDSLGFQVANNALIGFQNFNDVLSAKDYEKEYNQMLIDTGNTDQRYNTNNPTNPYGTYTPNVGIGSNYGLVANGPIQDFGIGKFGGMKKKYKEGGQYTLSQEEIDYIINNGGEIEFID